MNNSWTPQGVDNEALGGDLIRPLLIFMNRGFALSIVYDLEVQIMWGGSRIRIFLPAYDKAVAFDFYFFSYQNQRLPTRRQQIALELFNYYLKK